MKKLFVIGMVFLILTVNLLSCSLPRGGIGGRRIMLPDSMTPISLYNATEKYIVTLGMTQEEIEAHTGTTQYTNEEESNERTTAWYGNNPYSGLKVTYINGKAAYIAVNLFGGGGYYTDRKIGVGYGFGELYRKYNVPRGDSYGSNVRFKIIEEQGMFTVELMPPGYAIPDAASDNVYYMTVSGTTEIGPTDVDTITIGTSEYFANR